MKIGFLLIAFVALLLALAAVSTVSAADATTLLVSKNKRLTRPKRIQEAATAWKRQPTGKTHVRPKTGIKRNNRRHLMMQHHEQRRRRAFVVELLGDGLEAAYILSLATIEQVLSPAEAIADAVLDFLDLNIFVFVFDLILNLVGKGIWTVGQTVNWVVTITEDQVLDYIANSPISFGEMTNGLPSFAEGDLLEDLLTSVAESIISDSGLTLDIILSEGAATAVLNIINSIATYIMSLLIVSRSSGRRLKSLESREQDGTNSEEVEVLTNREQQHRSLIFGGAGDDMDLFGIVSAIFNIFGLTLFSPFSLVCVPLASFIVADNTSLATVLCQEVFFGLVELVLALFSDNGMDPVEIVGNADNDWLTTLPPASASFVTEQDITGVALSTGTDPATIPESAMDMMKFSINSIIGVILDVLPSGGLTFLQALEAIIPGGFVDAVLIELIAQLTAQQAAATATTVADEETLVAEDP